MTRTVQGINHTWQVNDTPIGSGDAGEVYAVVCQNQPDLVGMMKKPLRIATAGTIQRQAGQIANEALALQRLDGLPNSKARPPRLLDQAPDYTSGTANYFIISETALGEDLDSILAQTRKTGKPFPRRVIMTVLDALFDMFSRAHKSGVLWNDVKLEHIYWHNLSGQVGVIDWGNALFLDSNDQQVLPRWEDYQQMIETLGNFLQRTAPELYVDLGWEEFQGQTLDSSQVSVLARRITYQQQVISLQVMEYQSLMRVVLEAEPSLEGLRKIEAYQNKLEKIGAPWGHADVLAYSHSLVETALENNDRQACVSTTTLVWEIFDESLDLHWHLMREYCRHTDILTHPAFATLITDTLNTHWKRALWSACIIASQAQEPHWWDRLIPVIRQKAIGTATPPPLQTCRSLFQWAQGHQDHNLAQQLQRIIQDWREKGSDLADSPFDYDLLDIIREEKNIPIRLLSEIKKSFVPGDEAIRELEKTWTNEDWDALPKAFQRTLSWDPDRWGILDLADQVESFHTWCQELYQGSGEDIKASAFFKHMQDSRPKIERALGSPAWMRSLKIMLDQILQGTPIAALQVEVSRYCPWLLAYPDLPSADAGPPHLDESARQALLNTFLEHLKIWHTVDDYLQKLSEKAPDIHALTSRLTNGFKQFLLLNAKLNDIAAIATESLPPELAEAAQILKTLHAWRTHLDNGEIDKANQSLSNPLLDTWTLAVHAQRITQTWQNLILPYLIAIQTYTSPTQANEPQDDPQLAQLHHISQLGEELPTLWALFDKTGIHANILEGLNNHIEEVRLAFLEWRGLFESTSDPISRLVYHSQLDSIRQVSNRFLRMAQNIRQANLAFANMMAEEKTTIPFQLKQIEIVLEHLAAVEVDIIGNPDKLQYPAFLSDFQRILTAKTTESRQEKITALPENHPFYTWLVKSSLTQDTFCYYSGSPAGK